MSTEGALCTATRGKAQDHVDFIRRESSGAEGRHGVRAHLPFDGGALGEHMLGAREVTPRLSGSQGRGARFATLPGAGKGKISERAEWCAILPVTWRCC